MSKKLNHFITPEARVDFSEAKLYYAQLLVTGLSKKFSMAVKQTILWICENPNAVQIKYSKIRVTKIKGFPYAIHYFLNQNQIIITAIISFHRDPNIAKKRII